MAFAAPIAAGLSVVSSLVGGAAKSNAASYNASVDEANARATENQGAAEELDIDRRSRAMAGDALVAQGQSGFQLGTGSALALLRQNAINAQYDILNARSGAAGKAAAYRTDAAAQRSQAKSAMIGGVLSAGASALSSGLFGGAGGAASVAGASAMPLPISALAAAPIGNTRLWDLGI